MEDFLIFVGLFQWFFHYIKGKPKAGDDDPSCLCAYKKIIPQGSISRFINASWELMPYEPFVTLHIKETQTIKSKLKSISVED